LHNIIDQTNVTFTADKNHQSDWNGQIPFTAIMKDRGYYMLGQVVKCIK